MPVPIIAREVRLRDENGEICARGVIPMHAGRPPGTLLFEGHVFVLDKAEPSYLTYGHRAAFRGDGVLYRVVEVPA